MIVVDASETRSNSRLAAHSFPHSTSTTLEELTGADMLITPLAMPVTASLLPRHLSSGALMVQLKFGADLASSLKSRLKNSICKMRATGAAQAQCVLVLVGDMGCTHNGKVVLDGQVLGIDYMAVMAGVWHWAARGGVYLPVTNESKLVEVLEYLEKDLVNFGKTKEFYVVHEVAEFPFCSDEDVLQPIRKIRDWRPMLAAFDGVGPVRATSLRNAMLEYGALDTFGQALVWATEPKEMRGWMPKVADWGDKTFEKVREQVVGKEDGVTMCLTLAECGGEY